MYYAYVLRVCTSVTKNAMYCVYVIMQRRMYNSRDYYATTKDCPTTLVLVYIHMRVLRDHALMKYDRATYVDDIKHLEIFSMWTDDPTQC